MVIPPVSHYPDILAFSRRSLGPSKLSHKYSGHIFWNSRFGAILLATRCSGPKLNSDWFTILTDDCTEPAAAVYWIGTGSDEEQSVKQSIPKSSTIITLCNIANTISSHLLISISHHSPSGNLIVSLTKSGKKRCILLSKKNRIAEVSVTSTSWQ